MYQRPHLEVLNRRLSEPRRFIQVLVGPRQVGKTTLARQFMQSTQQPVQYFSADENLSADPVWIFQNWESSRLKLNQLGGSEMILIFDEIQKVNSWSQSVKEQWDKDSLSGTNIKVILLGSARLTIQQGLTESLAGRFELIPLSHWSLSEMEAAFGFTPEQFVWFGGFPGAAPLMNDLERWRSYVMNSLIETTLSKDILMLMRVDKPALLKKLFELGCAYSGQILSFNKMLGQLQDAGNTTTLSNYLSLLESAGMLAGLEKYGKSPLSVRASSPKLQVLNTAYISAYTSSDLEKAKADSAHWGRVIETAIGAHLYNKGKAKGIEVFYWREGNNEIDFVIVRNQKLIGIEVKSGFSSGTTGMSAFQRLFNPDKVLLISNEGLTWQEFLRIPPETLF